MQCHGRNRHVQRGCGGAYVHSFDATWLAMEPVDMRAGADTLLARVVKMFGSVRPHAYLFVNRHSTRMQVPVYMDWEYGLPHGGYSSRDGAGRKRSCCRWSYRDVSHGSCPSAGGIRS